MAESGEKKRPRTGRRDGKSFPIIMATGAVGLSAGLGAVYYRGNELKEAIRAYIQNKDDDDPPPAVGKGTGFNENGEIEELNFDPYIATGLALTALLLLTLHFYFQRQQSPSAS